MDFKPDPHWRPRVRHSANPNKRAPGLSDEVIDWLAPRDETIDGIDGDPAIDRLLKELEL